MRIIAGLLPGPSAADRPARGDGPERTTEERQPGKKDICAAPAAPARVPGGGHVSRLGPERVERKHVVPFPHQHASSVRIGIEHVSLRFVGLSPTV
jgi:hypothetical protein